MGIIVVPLRRACIKRERERAKDITVLVFPEKPVLGGGGLHYPFGEGLGELPAGGIIIVCPICSFRSFSM